MSSELRKQGRLDRNSSKIFPAKERSLNNTFLSNEMSSGPAGSSIMAYRTETFAGLEDEPAVAILFGQHIGIKF